MNMLFIHIFHSVKAILVSAVIK